MYYRWFLVVLVLIAVAVLVVLRWRQSSAPEPHDVPSAKTPAATEPGISLEGVEGLVLRQGGRKVWKLFVDTVTLDKLQTKATAQGVRKAIYYDKDGKALLWFSAQTLLYDANAGQVTLTGNIQVEARLSKGRMLIGYAEQAVWHERNRLLEISAARGQADETHFLIQRVRYDPDKTVLEGHDGVIVMTPKVHLTCPTVRTNLTTRYLIAQPPIHMTAILNGAAPFQPVAFRLLAQNPSPQKPDAKPDKPDGKKPEPKPDEKPPAEKEKRRMHFKTTKPVVSKKGLWFMEDAVITEEGEDYTITVRKATYDEDTKQVQIDEGVRFEDPETVAMAPKAQVDTKERVAVFTGPVEVIVKPKKEGEQEPGKEKESGKPKPESKPGDNKGNGQAKPNGQVQQSEKPTEQKPEGEKRESLRERARRRGGRMVCDRAEYHYRERRVVATGNVRFEQEKRYKGTAEKAVYLTREEILTLEGNVIVDDLQKGHRFQCPKIVVNLETDEVEITPPIEGYFIVEEEEEKKPTEKEKEGKPEPEAPKPAPPQ